METQPSSQTLLRPPKDIKQMLDRFKEATEKKGVSKKVSIGKEKHSSLKKLEELEKITLGEMSVNKIHFGRYLICKIGAKPVQIVNKGPPLRHHADESEVFVERIVVYVYVEDENGEMEELLMHNCVQTSEEMVSWLPVETVIFIKEPFLRANRTGGVFIEILTPSDVILANGEINLDKFVVEKWKKEETRSFDELKALGNKCFNSKKNIEALQFYNAALKLKEDAKALSNRAATYLNLEMPFQAFRDAKRSADLEPTEKAFFRMGRAAYEMRQWQISKDSFQKCLDLNPDRLDATNEIQRCHERLTESKTGVYDLIKLYNEAAENGTLRMDLADYTSDKIEIRDIEGKGKGIVATQKITKGTLLVASKAVSVAFQSEAPQILSWPQSTRYLDETPTCALNLSKLYRKLRSNPQMAKQVYALYGGPQFDRNETLDEFVVDVGRVDEIYRLNKMRAYKSFTKNIMSEFNMREGMSGLWVMPSYFNHSCMPVQAQQISFGDFLMTFASRDLEPGEEITINTLESQCPINTYVERKSHCARFSFVCECHLCTVDKNDAQLEARAEFCKNETEKLETSLSKCLKNVEKIRSLYENRPEYQFDLVTPLISLGIAYHKDDKPAKAAEAFMQIYAVTKGSDYFSAVNGLLNALNQYLDCEKYKQVTEVLYQILDDNVIGDKAFFMRRFQKDIHQFDLEQWFKAAKEIPKAQTKKITSQTTNEDLQQIDESENK